MADDELKITGTFDASEIIDGLDKAGDAAVDLATKSVSSFGTVTGAVANVEVEVNAAATSIEAANAKIAGLSAEYDAAYTSGQDLTGIELQLAAAEEEKAAAVTLGMQAMDNMLAAQTADVAAKLLGIEATEGFAASTTAAAVGATLVGSAASGAAGQLNLFGEAGVAATEGTVAFAGASTGAAEGAETQAVAVADATGQYQLFTEAALEATIATQAKADAAGQLSLFETEAAGAATQSTAAFKQLFISLDEGANATVRMQKAMDFLNNENARLGASSAHVFDALKTVETGAARLGQQLIQTASGWKVVTVAEEEAEKGVSAVDRAMAGAGIRMGSGILGLGQFGYALGAVGRSSSTLAPILANLFPIILFGVAIDLLFKLAQGIQDIEDKVSEIQIPWAAWGTETTKQLISVNEEILKLDDSIGKTFGELPQNGIAIAAEEATKKLIELDGQIQKDSADLEKLFKDKSVNYFDSITTGQASTGTVKDEFRQPLQKNANADATLAEARSTKELDNSNELAAINAAHNQTEIDQIKAAAAAKKQANEEAIASALQARNTSTDALLQQAAQSKKNIEDEADALAAAAKKRAETLGGLTGAAAARAGQQPADRLPPEQAGQQAKDTYLEQQSTNLTFLKQVTTELQTQKAIEAAEPAVAQKTSELGVDTKAEQDRNKLFAEKTAENKAAEKEAEDTGKAEIAVANEVYAAKKAAIDKETADAVLAGKNKIQAEIDAASKIEDINAELHTSRIAALDKETQAVLAARNAQQQNITANKVGTPEETGLTASKKDISSYTSGASTKRQEEASAASTKELELEAQTELKIAELMKQGGDKQAAAVRTTTADLINEEKIQADESTKIIEAGASEQLNSVKDQEQLHTLTIAQARDQRLAIYASEQDALNQTLTQERETLQTQADLLKESIALLPANSAGIKELSKVYEKLANRIAKVVEEQQNLNTKLGTDEIKAQTDAWKQEQAEVTNLTNSITNAMNSFVVEISTTTGKAHALFVNMVVNIERDFLQMILKMIEQTKLFQAVQNELTSGLDKVFGIPNKPPTGSKAPGSSADNSQHIVAVTNNTTAIQALTNALLQKQIPAAGAPTIPSIEAGTGATPEILGRSPGTAPSAPNLDSLVKAISDQEGYGKAGAIPTKANNPGDLKLGDAGLGVQAHGETNFDTLQQGQDALRHQLQIIGNGTSPVYNEHAKDLGLDNSSQLNLNQFGSKYAEDPNYGANIASRLQVPPTTTIGSIVGNQQPASGVASTAPAAAQALETPATGAPVPVTIVGGSPGIPQAPAPIQQANTISPAPSIAPAAQTTSINPVPALNAGIQVATAPTPQKAESAGISFLISQIEKALVPKAAAQTAPAAAAPIAQAAAPLAGGAPGQGVGDLAAQQTPKLAAAVAQQNTIVLGANTQQTLSTAQAKIQQNTAIASQTPVVTVNTTTQTTAVTAGQAIQATATRAGETAKTQATLTGSLTRMAAEAKEVALDIGHIAASVVRFVLGENTKKTAAVASSSAIEGSKAAAASGEAAAVAASTAKTISANALAAVSNVATAATYAFMEAAASTPFPADLVAAPAAAASMAASGAGYVTLASAAQGAVLDKDQLVNAHANEMILPVNLSTGLQKLIQGGGKSAAPNTLSAPAAELTSHTANTAISSSANVASSPAGGGTASAGSAQGTSTAETNIGQIAQNSTTSNQYDSQIAANTEDIKEDTDQLSGNNKLTHALNRATGGMLGAGGMFTPPGMFAGGGIVDKDGPIFAHAKEMVLPTHIAEGFQGLIQDGGAHSGVKTAQQAATTSAKSEHDISRAQAQMQQISTSSLSEAQTGVQVQANTAELVQQGQKQQQGGFSSFFHTISMGLFEDGGITSGGPAILHANEMVLPAPISQGFQSLFSRATNPADMTMALAGNPDFASALNITSKNQFDYEGGDTANRIANSTTSGPLSSSTGGAFHYHDHTNVSSWDSKDTGDFMQDNRQHLANAFKRAMAKGQIDPRKLRGRKR